MTDKERRKAAEWFENRAKNCPMPATRRMYEIAVKALEQEPKTEWIPVKFRPLTEEEQEEYPHYCYFADCLMPDDGEEILVTTRHGTVEKDVAGFDDGFYLDSGYDWGTDVVAWSPLPEPYKVESEDKK